MVDALHVNLSEPGIIGQSLPENVLDLSVPDGTALHGKQIVFLIHAAKSMVYQSVACAVKQQNLVVRDTRQDADEHNDE